MCGYYFNVWLANLVTRVFFEYSALSEPKGSQYAMSHTSVLGTSISKTSPGIGSSEPKSQEKATVSFMYRYYVQDTRYRTLCTRHFVQTLSTGHYVQDTMYGHYLQDTMYRILITDTMYGRYVQTLCTRHYVQTLCTRHYVQDGMYRHYLQDTIYKHYVQT